MAKDVPGLRTAFMMANEGVERVELTEPWRAVVDAGAKPKLLAPEATEVQTFDHLDRSKRYAVDQALADTDPASFDALMLPGGVANADALRIVPEAVRFVHDFVENERPVAVICHGPWILIEAGAVQGRRITSWPSLRTDLINAGANWVDEEVVVDRNGPAPMVSSRKPADLPAFCRSAIAVFHDAMAASGGQFERAGSGRARKL